jgi:hypothetical protein
MNPGEMFPDDEDSELVVVSQNVDVICPLSRTIFENPVKKWVDFFCYF